jgi:RHS repeat-associated protein
MRCGFLATVLSTLALFTCPTISFGQTVSDPINIGFPPNAVFSGSNFDSVNIENGNLHFEIPLWSTDGRGIAAGYRLIYDSKGWISVDHCSRDGSCSSAIQKEPGNHLILVLVGPLDYSYTSKSKVQHCTSPSSGFITVHYNAVLRETDGTKHHMVPDSYYTDTTQPGCYDTHLIPNPTFYADDASGWSATTRKDGLVITVGSTLEDSNGNQILAGNGSTVPATDTLGRTIPTDGSYYDSSGTQRLVQISYTSVNEPPTNLCQFAPYSPCQEVPGGAWSVPHIITLPNGQTYTINYNGQDGYGLPSSVTLPTGGQISWTWGPLDTGGKWVASRTVTTGGVSSTWTYSTITSGHAVTDPNGNDTTDKCTTSAPHNGCLTRQMQYFSGSYSSGQLTKTVSTDFSTHVCSSINITSTDCDFLPIRATTTWNQANVVTKNETDWYFTTMPVTGDPITWGNALETREFDYGTGAPGAQLRRTDFTYVHQTNTNFLNANIADRIASKIVYAGISTTPSAQTTYTYDGFPLTQTSGAPNHDYTNFGYTSTKPRGNLTQVSRWLNTSSTWLNTNNTYNDLGDLLSTTDPRNNTTNFSYADNFTDGVNRNAQAFVTQTTYPTTNGIAHIERNQFYWSTGLPAASCGQNFPAATACTNSAPIPQPDYTKWTYDSVNRPLNVTRGDGGQTNYSYNDTAQPLSTSATQSITSSLARSETEIFDGLGRVSQTQLTSDPQGITYTDTTYDALGRKSAITNPHRTASSPTDGTTTFYYDALGRTCLLVPPDGTQPSGSSCPSTRPTGDVLAVYSGNTVTVTDEAGKSRKSISDGLDHLTQVFEDPAGLNYETDYQYDALDNLTRVDQKGGDLNSANWRTRTFTYNSLSQLLTAANPESGTISYVYDSDGNLSTKTAPKPNQTGSLTVVTTDSYDALNRLTQKSYSDGTTPTVKYGYDGVAPSGCTPPTLTIGNPIGRRTSMCDAGGASAWSLDLTTGTGWKITEARTTNGITKNTIYQDNFGGSLTTLTNPSSRAITYTLQSSGTNTAGRMVSAVDTANSINYATAAAYAPTGALSSLTNGASLVETNYYNSRLQPCRISAKSSGNAPTSCTDSANIGNVLDFTYNFNLGSADNGNVTSIANNRDTTRSPSFTYDALNRLSTAKTSSTSGTKCWDEQFGYDPWANLLTIGRISGYTCSNEELLNVVATPNNRISGYTYDSAGNLINDGLGHTYTFNAENQLLTAAGVTYTYDGDGKRVQKSNGKLYWYGTGSDPLTETDASGNPTAEYVFFNGKRTARIDLPSAVVHYYFSDHLGSANIVTSSAGVIQDESDYYPFGGERTITNSDPNNFKFTGKERDTESGLDNFGDRYDSTTLGRFMSPDWSDYPEPVPYAQLASPQSLNLYSYVQNDPLNMTDDDGHEPKADAKCGFLCTLFNRIFGGGNSKPLVTVTFTPVQYPFPPAQSIHTHPEHMQPGINYGNNSPGKYLVGGCPGGTCHTLDGLYPPLERNLNPFAWVLLGLGGVLGSMPSGAFSVEDVLANPTVLKGMAPEEVEQMIGNTPGWKVERLAQGSKQGQGWVLREYSAQGNPTGRLIRWHPGGGHHGSFSYWRVSSGSGGKSGIIPGKP